MHKPKHNNLNHIPVIEPVLDDRGMAWLILGQSPGGQIRGLVCENDSDALDIHLTDRILSVRGLPPGFARSNLPKIQIAPHPDALPIRAFHPAYGGLIWWLDRLFADIEDLLSRPVLRLLTSHNFTGARLRAAVDQHQHPVCLLDANRTGLIHPHEPFRIGPLNLILDPALFGLTPIIRQLPEPLANLPRLVTGQETTPTETYPEQLRPLILAVDSWPHPDTHLPWRQDVP